MPQTQLIDDFSQPGTAVSGTAWEFVSDRVMGGVSTGSASFVESDA
ncbi:MAG: hypothetical protein AB8B57_03965 [Congregibacter sp.]